MADQLLKVRENVQTLNEMKKVSIEFKNDRDSKYNMRTVKYELEKKGHKVEISGNMLTVTAKRGSDIGREARDVRNFYTGVKRIKALESVEEETLDEAKYQVNYSKNNKLYSQTINARNEDDAEEKAIKKFKITDDDIRSVVKEETLDEGRMKELAMKIAQVYSNMKKDKNMRSFADKFRKDVAKSLDIRKSLEKVLPDYVAGKDITNIMSKHVPGHKEEGLDEKVSYVEYKFKNARDAGAAKKYFDAQQRMSFDVNDDNIRGGELMVDAGKNDMTQFHKEVMKKFRPKVMSTEAKLIDKPTGEVLKTGSKKEMETERKRNRDELQVKEWFKSKGIDVTIRKLDDATQAYVRLGKIIPNEIREDLVKIQYGELPEDIKNTNNIVYGNFKENSITMNNEFWKKVFEARKDDPSQEQDTNIIMQLRKSVSLKGMKDVEFNDGKKVKVKPQIANAVMDKFDTYRTTDQKLKFQQKIAKSYKDLLSALKEK